MPYMEHSRMLPNLAKLFLIAHWVLHPLEALEQAGAENLKDKILIDTSNPLDRSSEIWTLTVCNTNSLGEQDLNEPSLKPKW